MNAVDTNVLIYTHDPRDSVKQNKAVALIASLADGALLWQVACEYVAASRKLEPYGLSRAQAMNDLRRLRNVWKPVAPSWAVMDRAETLMSSGSVSFWDALILAACVEGGVTRLFSEDFDDSLAATTGVQVINPFI